MILPTSMLDAILPTPSTQKTAVQPAQVTFKPYVASSSTKTTTTPDPAAVQKPFVQQQRTQVQLRKQREAEQARNDDNTRATQDDADTCDGGNWLNEGSQSGSGQSDGDEEGGEENSATGMTGRTRSAAELEAQELAAILPNGDCNGIFDVTLPNGEKLGVAVDANAKKATYMLTPGSEKMAANLIKKQKELNACLERRIGRDVQLIVL